MTHPCLCAFILRQQITNCKHIAKDQWHSISKDNYNSSPIPRCPTWWDERRRRLTASNRHATIPHDTRHGQTKCHVTVNQTCSECSKQTDQSITYELKTYRLLFFNTFWLKLFSAKTTHSDFLLLLIQDHTINTQSTARVQPIQHRFHSFASYECNAPVCFLGHETRSLYHNINALLTTNTFTTTGWAKKNRTVSEIKQLCND